MKPDKFWRLVQMYDAGLVSRETLVEAAGLAVRGDAYGDYPVEEKKQMSLSKYPFEPGTLVKVRARKPFKGSEVIVLHTKMRWPPKSRSHAYGEERRVPGWGYWTVVERDKVSGVGWWHKVVRGDGEMGWVEDIQKDFVVVKPEEETK